MKILRQRAQGVGVAHGRTAEQVARRGPIKKTDCSRFASMKRRTIAVGVALPCLGIRKHIFGLGLCLECTTGLVRSLMVASGVQSCACGALGVASASAESVGWLGVPAFVEEPVLLVCGVMDAEATLDPK